MRINDARNLRIGEKVMTPGGFPITVWSLNEFIFSLGKNTIIYVKGKTENGDIMKFSHKELKLM